MVFWKKLLLTRFAQFGLRHSTCSMNLEFLPTWPFLLSYPLLFGVLLVAGMIGGGIAPRAPLPRLTRCPGLGLLLAPPPPPTFTKPPASEARALPHPPLPPWP